MTPEAFRERLMTFCAATGGSVASYGRTAWHNAAVGGVELSPHRFWVAADVRYWEHLTPAEQAKARARLGPSFSPPLALSAAMRAEIAARLGLRLIAKDDHDHLQPLDWKAG